MPPTCRSLARSLPLLLAACATSPESIATLPQPEQWRVAEAAQADGDLDLARMAYETIFVEQRVPAAAWRCTEVVAELRRRQPGLQLPESDDSLRLVPRILALALEGDAATARSGIALMHGRLAGSVASRGLATLLLGDLDLREGDYRAAAAKYWSVTGELLMDDYRDGGSPPSEIAYWSALREIECAMLQGNWLLARRRLGIVDAIHIAPAGRPYANPALCERVRRGFPQWLDGVKDPSERRAGVHKQLAARNQFDGKVTKVGDVVARVVAGEGTECELLLASGDVLTAAVPRGQTLDPMTFVGHGRIDRHDGAIQFGIVDRGRLREGVSIAPIGTFDVVDDFQVQNSVVLPGSKLRAGGSVQRDALRVFRTIYDGDRVAVDYFDRRTGRHLQLCWHDLSLVSAVNEPMKLLSDADRADELAREEHWRRYGAQQATEDQAAREWRERTGARAFQFNVEPENLTCLRCNGVGMIWQGGYSTQTPATWIAARDRTVFDIPTTVHHSGEMVTCTWCQGTGRR